METHNYIGLVGVALYVCAYFLLQLGRIDGNGNIYCLANLAAASLVLWSLSVDFNLSSVLIQITWVVLSIVGLGRRWRARTSQNAVAIESRDSLWTSCVKAAQHQ